MRTLFVRVSQPVGLAVFAAVALAFPLYVVGGEQPAAEGAGTSSNTVRLPELLGLEDPNTFVPADNPLTARKVELGRLLFFDTRLSKTNTIACASCHIPALAFTDGQSVSSGINIYKVDGARPPP